MNTTINNDRFLKRAISTVTPESPGENFVISVMQKIEVLSQKQTVKHEPLISWKGWIIISILSTAMFALVFFTDFSGISFDKISNGLTDFAANYLSIFLSRLFAVSMVILAILFLIQIRMVVNRIDRMQKTATDNI